MLHIDVKKELHSSQGKMLLDINLNIPEGSFTSLFGRSGAGKTTLLKMLAGLVLPDEGVINSADETWLNKQTGVNVIPQKRNIGFVFQDYALFPNMSVRGNLEFVLHSRKNINLVHEILELTGLKHLSSRFPAELSGGQQQRLALARSLVRQPKLLLLDEPFSSLDNEMRLILQDEIGKIHRHFGLTTILISHDPSEIYRLSDMVVEIDFGKVLKKGTPSEVFHHNEITGKFQMMGEVLDIEKNDIVFIVKVISGNKIVKVVLTRQQAENIAKGDKVLVTSKAFNPVLIKID